MERAEFAFLCLTRLNSLQHLLQGLIFPNTQVTLSPSSFMNPLRSSILLGSKTLFDVLVYSSCQNKHHRLGSHLYSRNLFPHSSGSREVKIECWPVLFLVRTYFLVADGHLPLCPDMSFTSCWWWREDTLSSTSVEVDTALRSFLIVLNVPQNLPLQSSYSSHTRGQGFNAQSLWGMAHS